MVFPIKISRMRKCFLGEISSQRRFCHRYTFILNNKIQSTCLFNFFFCSVVAMLLLLLLWIELNEWWCEEEREEFKHDVDFLRIRDEWGWGKRLFLYVMWYKAGYYGNHEGGNTWVVMCVCICVCVYVCTFILYIYFQRRWVGWVGIFNFIVFKCEKIENFIKRMWQIIIMWCTMCCLHCTNIQHRQHW